MYEVFSISLRYKPKYEKRIWEFGSLDFSLVRDLETDRIVEARGNPDVAYAVEIIHRLADYKARPRTRRNRFSTGIVYSGIQ